jgi:flagellar hook-length control protein FliK
MSISALPFLSLPAEPVAMAAGNAAATSVQTSPFAALIAEFSQTQTAAPAAENSVPAIASQPAPPQAGQIPGATPQPVADILSQLTGPPAQPIPVVPPAQPAGKTGSVDVVEAPVISPDTAKPADRETAAPPLSGVIMDASAFNPQATAPDAAATDALTTVPAMPTPAAAVTMGEASDAALTEVAPALSQLQVLPAAPSAQPVTNAATPSQSHVLPAAPIAQPVTKSAAPTQPSPVEDASPAATSIQIDPSGTEETAVSSASWASGAAPVRTPVLSAAAAPVDAAATVARSEPPRPEADAPPVSLETAVASAPSEQPPSNRAAEAGLTQPANGAPARPAASRPTVPVATLATLVLPQAVGAGLEGSDHAIGKASLKALPAVPEPQPTSAASPKPAAETATTHLAPINPDRAQPFTTETAATEKQAAPQSASRDPAAPVTLAGPRADNNTTVQPAAANSSQAVLNTTAIAVSPPIPPAQAVDAPVRLTQLANGLHDMHAVAVRIAHRAAAGDNHFEIRLDPPELGRIDVRLDVDRNGQVQTQLSAERPQTLELLQRDASSLERALKDAGLDSTGLSFSLKGDSRQGQAQNNDASRGYPQNFQTNDTAMASAEILPLRGEHSLSAEMRLDIRV